MEKTKQYSKLIYNLNSDEINKLKEFNYKKIFLDLGFLIISIFVLIKVSILLINFNFLLLIPILFIIAGRQGVILQFMHECAHYLVFKKRYYNDYLGSFLGLLIGLNFSEYKNVHRLHHANAATVNEPITDMSKYQIVNTNKKELYIEFFKDLLGVSALKIFLNYSNDLSNTEKNKNKINLKNFFKKLAFLSFVQLILLILLFNGNIIQYILLWVYPLAGPHVFMMRVRGIAEHGLHRQEGKDFVEKNEGLYFTRSFLTPHKSYKNRLVFFFEKILIGTLNVNFHHEHHLDPKIPYYNLEKFHLMIKDKIKFILPNKIYEKGYFSAVFNRVKI